MVRRALGQSTRSIYLGLALISLTLHLLLAIFCFSVLQFACVPPSSSSLNPSFVSRNDTVSQSSFSFAASSLNKPLSSNQNGGSHKTSAVGQKGKFNEAHEKAKKLISTETVVQKEQSRSKLEELFKNSLYNLPRPELQEDDWLLRLKTDEEAKDAETEDKNSITDDSEW